MLPHLKNEIAQAAQSLLQPQDRLAEVKKRLAGEDLDDPKLAIAYATALLQDKKYLADEKAALSQADRTKQTEAGSVVAFDIIRIQGQSKFSELSKSDVETVMKIVSATGPKNAGARDKAAARDSAGRY